MTVRFILADFLNVCLAQLFPPLSINSLTMTEEQPFTLIAKYPGFEVRHYPTYVLVQVETKGEFTSAASRAFRPLVNYISGNNRGQEKFAMTAPVLHAPDRKATNHTVSFVLPKDVSINDLPMPLDVQVSTVEVPGHFAAATKFRGLAGYEHFKSLGDRLKVDVKSAGLNAVGDPYYARFDPPWKPGFLRRNEAIVALAGYPSKGN